MAKDKGGGGGGNKGGGGGGNKGGGGGGGGGGQRSAPAPAPAPAPRPPAPAPVTVSAPRQSDGGNKKEDKKQDKKEDKKQDSRPNVATATRAVNFAQAYQSIAQPKPADKKQERNDGGGKKEDKKQERVQTLTEKAKALISGATSKGIADPNRFKDILGKLKDLGKDKRVDNLQTQKKEAVTTAKNALTLPGNNLTPGLDDNNSNATYITGYSQEDLDELLGSLQEDYGEKIGGLESQLGDLMGQLGKQQQQQQQQPQETGASEYDDWLQSFATEQDKGSFDPNLFRNLLGELESSKRRQKDWSERSAKAAYKY